MEDKELNILEVFEQLDNPSQREVAEETGMSLGMVNALVKRLVKKGLLKVEKLNSRNFHYLLTPHGLKKLTSRSLSYFRRSYRAVRELSFQIRERAQECKAEGRRICLYGPKDEVYDLARDIFKEMEVDYEHCSDLDQVEAGEKVAVFYWLPEDEEELKEGLADSKEVQVINILTGNQFKSYLIFLVDKKEIYSLSRKDYIDYLRKK